MPQLFMLTCKTRTLISSKPSLGFNKNANQQHGSTIHQPISSTCTYGYDQRSCLLRTQFVPITKAPSFYLFQPTIYKSGVSGGDIGALSDEDDDDLCPVDCVKEFKTDEEFFRILEKAKENDALVVVDFYRPSCGSCKYIEQGFAKLCRRAGDNEAPVIFLKHNVIDEYDEQSEVAERLRIKTVPLFHFYKGGVLLEAFPTRDKERITSAILKYSSPATKAI